MRAVLASRNPRKLREIRRILGKLPIEFIDLSEYPHIKPIEETGKTFIENAILKARSAAEATGEVCIGEDSGLEVRALGGRPGVLSARYGGDGLSDEDRVKLVLSEMAGVEDRRARFVCAVAICFARDQIQTFQSAVEGILTTEPRGLGGFGYDPIFLLPERGVTTAEISAEEKNAISHRGRALREAAPFLARLLGSAR